MPSLREELSFLDRPVPAPEPRATAPVVEDQGEGDVIAKLREVIASQAPAKINGTMIDTFSASAAIQVYDSLEGENQRRMESLPIKKMMWIVLKMLAKRTG